MANPQIDWAVIGFTTAAAVICGILLGITPAIQLGAINVRSLLNESDRSVAGVRAVGFRRGLVIAEIALAIPLLVSAGLLMRTLSRLSAVTQDSSPITF